MKPISIALSIIAMAVATACSTPDRSRDLGNPAVSGKTLAQQVCINCHGFDGNTKSPNFPNLAGQQEAYLVSQLKDYRGHSRSDPAGFEYMWGLSKPLSDDQITELAKYYAAQKPLAGDAGDPALATEGKRIFTKGNPEKETPPCASCHGAEGQGVATFPRLAGQHADYIVKQLNVFQRTDERPEGAVMKTVAHGMSEQDMLAVATYLQGLASK